MIFTLSSSQLNTKLSMLSKVILSKNRLPILDSVLFDIQDNKLTMTASDGENTFKTSMELENADVNARLALNMETLTNAVRELPDQPLTFDVNMETYTVLLKYSNGKFNFTAQNGEEYPETKELGEDKEEYSIPSETLLTCISRSLFAAAPDGPTNLRPVMTGLFFQCKEDAMAIVSTDCHNLVRNRITTYEGKAGTEFIVPRKPATLLKSMLTKSEENIKITTDGQNAMFVFDDNCLVCRLIEGHYPNYEAVIPKNNESKLMINRKVLLTTLRRVLPFASESSQLLRLSLSEGQLIVSAEDLDFSVSAKESLICAYEGMPMDIGFRGSTLVDTLNNMECEEVILKLADPSRPGLFLPDDDPEGNNLLILVMPMMLNN